MKRVLLSLSVLALSTATAAGASTLYIPIVKATGPDGSRLATRLWLGNFGTEEASYQSVFLRSGDTGVERKALGGVRRVPVDRTYEVRDAVTSGEAGLLAIEAGPDLQVDAWIQTKGRDGRLFMGGVPVITDFNRVASGENAYLKGLSAGRTAQLNLVNLGSEAAFCTVDLVRDDGTLIGGNLAADVPPMGLRPVADALRLDGDNEGAVVRASCDQPFYAFSLEVDRATSQVSLISPTRLDAPVLAPLALEAQEKAGRATPPPAPIVFERLGVVHTAVRGHEKLKLSVPVAKALLLNRLTWEADVRAGGWNDKKPACAHNIAFFHRGKFRSNTFTNLNAFGPNKYWLKNNQNIDLPAGQNTNARINFRFEKGDIYHITYEFDAVNKMVHVRVMLGLQEVARLDMKATAQNHVLTVPATGLVLELGNLKNQVGCEVPSYNWSWINLRLKMYPKP